MSLSASLGHSHHLASPIGPKDSAGRSRSMADLPAETRSMYQTKTALGSCMLDTVGHLKPCDDKHAPIRLYRSYGEWWEAGQRAADAPHGGTLRQSRYWPYGQDVTKLYQTAVRDHKYQLDQRTVEKVRPYIPPRNGSLPDLRVSREARRQGEFDHDITYHSSFHRDDPRAPMLGLSGTLRCAAAREPGMPYSPPTGRSVGGLSVGSRSSSRR
mmetsp:Transcript_19558/g.31709  ORF Transcript_19558/g.31709 Transcript_19558/m.31709 type:complete len:213 (+) Transcript_19558:107-745(+)